MSQVNNISILFERIARVIQNDAHQYGLKPTQWEALRFLARANKFSRSPGALTAYLGVTKGTVSQTLLALEKKELIRKSTNAADKRSVQLSLTDKGHKLIKADPLSAIDLALEGEVNNDLDSQLKEVLNAMLEKRSGRPFGLCKTCTHFEGDKNDEGSHFCALLSEPLSMSDGESICIEQECL